MTKNDVTNRRLQLDKKPMPYTYEHNLDNYGYPFAPGPRGRLRKQAIRTSKSILGKCIYLIMSLIGVLLWLGRLGRKHRPLTPLSAHPRRILVIRLRARPYDIAISVFGNWAGLLAILGGAKRRVGFGRESYPGFMTDSVPGRHWSPNDHKHEVDYCLELAQAAGATITPADRVPRLYVDPQASQQLEQLLLKEGLQPGKPLIACHVSSNNGQSKRWPIPYWATLIDKLMREQDAQVVLTGASGDLPLIESVTPRMQEHAINLAANTSLPHLLPLPHLADLL